MAIGILITSGKVYHSAELVIFAPMKIPIPEEKKKEAQEIVWEIPIFDSHSVLQEKMLQKKILYQHTKGKRYFQLRMNYFLPKSALSLSFLLLYTLCFSWAIVC